MTDDSYRGKARATFLAAIMVLSMVAMSATLVAPAAAQLNDDVDNELDYDSQITYQGQDAFAFGTAITNDGDYQIRSVDSFDTDDNGDSFVDSSSFESEVDEDDIVREGEDATNDLTQGAVDYLDDEVDGDLLDNDNIAQQPIIVIDTDDLDAGDYFVQGGDVGENPYQVNTLEVTVQDLTTEFSDADDDLPVQNDDLGEAFAELEMDSTRGTYSVNVTANGDLDNDELFDIFAYASAVNEDATTTDTLTGALENPAVSSVDSDGTINYGDDQSTDSIYALLSEDGAISNYDGVTIDELEDGEAGDGQYDLSEAQSFGSFNVQLYDSSEEDADEKILLRDVSDPEEDLSGIGLDEGTYDLEFNVFDTEASANAAPSFEVSEQDASINFDQDVYSQAAGDVVHVTADLEDTEEALVQFGDENSEFLDIFYIEDDDGDDNVEFFINTRMLGSDLSGSDTVDAVYSQDDIVDSVTDSGDDTGEDPTEFGGFEEDADLTPEFYDDSDVEDSETVDFGEYLEELDLIDNTGDSYYSQLIRPPQPASYDLAATAEPEFIAEDGESSLDDEDGFATVELTRPELGEINTWVGPEGSADDEETIEGLVNNTPLTQREDVAIDDLMVAQIEADGLYGHMTAISQIQGGQGFDAVNPNEEEGFDGDVLNALADEQEVDVGHSDGDGDGIVDLTGEGIEFTFEDQAPTGNQEENSLQLTENTGNVFLLPDNENGELYVVVDTDTEPFGEDLDDGDRFDVSLEYITDDEDRFEFYSDGDDVSPFGDADGDAQPGPYGAADGDYSGDLDEAYPYYDAGESAMASTTFTFEDASAEFDNVEDDNVRITPSEDAVVSGTTNVAPESSTSVRVRNTGDNESFLYTEEVNVNEDGSFEASFDLSDREAGEDAIVQFIVRGSTVTEQSAVFGEAAEEAPFTPGVSIDVPSNVAPGDTMEASVTAENTGDVAGNATLSISVAGEEQFSETVSLDAGASTSETVSYTVPNDTNASSVSVSAEYGDASDSATVTIEQPDDGDEEQNGGTPGFGVAVAALALLSAALLARFRN